MKIATWNIERLKHKKSLDDIISACERVQADILVLTETDERVRLNYKYCFHSPTPPDIRLPHFEEPLRYKPTEHRVSIFTNYKCIRQHATFDKSTALCVELETEMGNLSVYGTIIGVYGNRRPSFMEDITKQVDDYKRLSALTDRLCICGDFNCSFVDNYYFTKDGRDLILQSFSENHINLLTKDIPACIDHIAVSEQLVGERKIQIKEWNQGKTLSDHKGIAVGFSEDFFATDSDVEEISKRLIVRNRQAYKILVE